VTYQTPTRHALLGSGRPPKTKLMTYSALLVVLRPVWPTYSRV